MRLWRLRFDSFREYRCILPVTSLINLLNTDDRPCWWLSGVGDVVGGNKSLKYERPRGGLKWVEATGVHGGGSTCFDSKYKWFRCYSHIVMLGVFIPSTHK